MAHANSATDIDTNFWTWNHNQDWITNVPSFLTTWQGQTSVSENPAKIVDDGTNSAWVRKLDGGSILVFFANQSGSSSNYTVNCSVLGGLETNVIYAGTNVMSGSFFGFVTNTVSSTISSGNSALIRLSPYFNVFNVNAASLTGIVPQASLPATVVTNGLPGTETNGGVNSSGVISANLVVSSNLVFWPQQMVASADFSGSKLDLTTTENPIQFPASIKILTNTIGTTYCFLPNWTTQCLSTITFQWSGTGPGLSFTNAYGIYYWPTDDVRNNGPTVNLVTMLQSNITVATVTNSCPDTNTLKAVRIFTGAFGTLTNPSAFPRILKWQVQLTGNVVAITNQ